jgi:predicted metal-dependent phosphoesterase TrpH
VIDLHLHTTASDGRSSPEQLVAAAAAAGLTTMAVTDHDTMAGVSAVVAAARAQGLECVPGIEITAIHAGRDVHVLAYFLDADNQELSGFLRRQRDDRRRRFFEIADTLERIGAPVDRVSLLETAGTDSRRALARPMLADALVRAGHVKTVSEAFDRFLGEGRPAYIPRLGASPREVIALVARAGGLTSLAHPGKMRLDGIIPALADAGLVAIEVHHPDHGPTDVDRYRTIAQDHGLLITGGSDYHGPGSGRTEALGRVTLPAGDYARLVERVGAARGPA